MVVGCALTCHLQLLIASDLSHTGIQNARLGITPASMLFTKANRPELRRQAFSTLRKLHGWHKEK
jgi:hypothetical protein